VLSLALWAPFVQLSVLSVSKPRHLDPGHGSRSKAEVLGGLFGAECCVRTSALLGRGRFSRATLPNSKELLEKHKANVAALGGGTRRQWPWAEDNVSSCIACAATQRGRGDDGNSNEDGGRGCLVRASSTSFRAVEHKPATCHSTHLRSTRDYQSHENAAGQSDARRDSGRQTTVTAQPACRPPTIIDTAGWRRSVDQKAGSTFDLSSLR
jgi:hypothetical protein